MSQRKSWWVRLVACVAMIACAGDGTFTGREGHELQDARTRWANSTVRKAYTFEVRMHCFCSEEQTRWNTITVVDDSVTDVRVTDTGLAAPRKEWRYLPTVEDIFHQLESGGDKYVSEVRATFDADYGYPLTAAVILSPAIIDGDVAFDARNLRPASGNP